MSSSKILIQRKLNVLKSKSVVKKKRVPYTRDYYRPQRSWSKVIFSVHRGGGVPGQVPPRDQVHPPGPGTPPGTRYTPGSCACWEIRATSGRYASYWNAFLFSAKFVKKVRKLLPDELIFIQLKF